tara:strand:- start:652 stop:828 length:177 start_codon:yes stop_codon:yes gene_type:complete
MATTTQLTKQTEQLQARVNQLVDQIYILQNELREFKTSVAGDVKYLTERVDGSNSGGR